MQFPDDENAVVMQSSGILDDFRILFGDRIAVSQLPDGKYEVMRSFHCSWVTLRMRSPVNIHSGLREKTINSSTSFVSLANDNTDNFLKSHGMTVTLTGFP